jgi:hypothetical protein
MEVYKSCMFQQGGVDSYVVEGGLVTRATRKIVIGSGRESPSEREQISAQVSRTATDAP